MEQPKNELEVIKQQVFSPGNLIWGTDELKQTDFPMLVQRGILPSISLSYYLRGLRPSAVCMGMMPLGQDNNPIHRYLNTRHNGPKKSVLREETDGTLLAIGIVISNKKLRATYQNQLAAIGIFFNLPFTREDYGFDPRTNTCFEIPISGQKYAPLPYDQEVIIDYSGLDKTDDIIGVTPEYWEAIVTRKREMLEIKALLANHGLPHLPVFSPDGDILM